MTARLHVVPTPAAVSTAVAGEFFRLASEVLSRQDPFRVALAGGTTPRAAYERIAETWREAGGRGFSWDRIHLYWGDERMVPADDPRSNVGMARAALIRRVPIPPGNVHPIAGDAADPVGAAVRYERVLRDSFGLAAGGLPRFDLALLGMGPDGHTASLFPGATTLEDSTHLAVAAHHPETDEPRVTLTLPVLNQAAATVVLVTGEEKSRTLRRAVAGSDGDTAPLPVELLKPQDGSLLWIASQDAAPWAPPGP